MALDNILSTMDINQWQLFSQLPQYGKMDDFAAMAVLAALGVLCLFEGVLWNRSDPNLYKMFERPQQHLDTHATPQRTRNVAMRLEQAVCAR